MAVAKLNDIAFYYEDKGEGPVVLLLAGLGSDSQSWMTVIHQLLRNFRVIAPDNRCCGRTLPELPETSIDLMADDAAALLRYLEIPKAAVVGHSMGGFIAMTMATKYPELVGNLVLEATSAVVSSRNQLLFEALAGLYESGSDARSWFSNLYFWLFSPSFFDKPQVVDVALKLSTEYPYNPSPAAFRGQTGAIIGFKSVDISLISAPTLVINGSLDLIFGASEARALADKIPDARMQTISGAGHSIHVEKFRDFMPVLRNFLLDNPW